MSGGALWRNLGLSMKRAREQCGWTITRLVLALRGEGDVDHVAEVARRHKISVLRRSRSTLYDAERGKPTSREVVEIYDALFDGGHGALIKAFEDARVGSAPRYRPSRGASRYPLPGDASEFVCDVTVPDGLMVPLRTTFTKTWRLRNVGTVTWQGRYLSRVGAAANYTVASSPRSVPVTTTAPGETVDLSVDITSPDVPGTCITYWKMTDADGNEFFPQYPQGISCLFEASTRLTRLPDTRIVRISDSE